MVNGVTAKVLTLASKVTGADGKASNNVAVFDKQ